MDKLSIKELRDNINCNLTDKAIVIINFKHKGEEIITDQVDFVFDSDGNLIISNMEL